jgi:hypothetical protein
MRALIHAANVIYLLSYLVRDILWLRLLTVIGGLLLIVYFSSPLVIEPIAWNCVFLALNLVQIWRLLLERRPVKLTDEELALYQLAFRALTVRQFVKVARTGSWKDLEAGEQLVAQGERLARVMVVLKGRLAVERDARRLTELGPGRLVGEMSYLTGAPTSARVVAEEPSRVIILEKQAIEGLSTTDPDLRAALQLVIGTDLVAKLRAT